MTSPSSIKVDVSLADIYGCLCVDCKAAVLHMLSAKAGHELVQEAIRRRLEGPVDVEVRLEPGDAPPPKEP